MLVAIAVGYTPQWADNYTLIQWVRRLIRDIEYFGIQAVGGAVNGTVMSAKK